MFQCGVTDRQGHHVIGETGDDMHVCRIISVTDDKEKSEKFSKGEM